VDDFLGASSEFRFGVTTSEKAKDVRAEYDKTLSQVPLLKEEIKRLDARIAATDSIKEAESVAKTYGISKENALIVLSIVNPILTLEKSIIEGRVRALANKR